MGFSWIWRCPGRHGFDLACLIRRFSSNKSTPIITVTGRDERDHATGVHHRSNFLSSEAGGWAKAEHLVPHCARRDVGESTPIRGCSNPNRDDVHGRCSNNTRGNLESQPRGDSGRSGWLAAQGYSAIVIPIAGIRRAARGNRHSSLGKREPTGNPVHELESTNEQSIRKFIAESGE